MAALNLCCQSENLEQWNRSVPEAVDLPQNRNTDIMALLEPLHANLLVSSVVVGLRV